MISLTFVLTPQRPFVSSSIRVELLFFFPFSEVFYSLKGIWTSTTSAISAVALLPDLKIWLHCKFISLPQSEHYYYRLSYDDHYILIIIAVIIVIESIIKDLCYYSCHWLIMNIIVIRVKIRQWVKWNVHEYYLQKKQSLEESIIELCYYENHSNQVYVQCNTLL